MQQFSLIISTEFLLVYKNYRLDFNGIDIIENELTYCPVWEMYEDIKLNAIACSLQTLPAAPMTRL